MVLNRKRWIDKSTSIILIVGLIIFILYSPTIVLEIPFFKISHLEINVKNEKLKHIVENIVKNKFQNNWLLLKLNSEKFNHLLRKSSQFYIEQAQINSFSFTNGNLKLYLYLNKPLFVINNKYFLAKNGRIFVWNEFLFKNYPHLIDKTYKWTLGDIYNPDILNQLRLLNSELKLKLVKISKYLLTVNGSNINLILPKEKLKNIKTVRRIQNLYVKDKLYVNLFGKKSFAVKILKE